MEEAQRWLNLNPFGVSNICRECRLLYFIIIIVIIICWLLTSAPCWRQRISIFTGGMPSTWKQSLQGTRPLHVLLCLSLCLFWFLQRLDQEDGGEIQFGQRASDPLTEFCGWNILIGFLISEHCCWLMLLLLSWLYDCICNILLLFNDFFFFFSAASWVICFFRCLSWHFCLWTRVYVCAVLVWSDNFQGM